MRANRYEKDTIKVQPISDRGTIQVPKIRRAYLADGGQVTAVILRGHFKQERIDYLRAVLIGQNPGNVVHEYECGTCVAEEVHRNLWKDRILPEMIFLTDTIFGLAPASQTSGNLEKATLELRKKFQTPLLVGYVTQGFDDPAHPFNKIQATAESLDHRLFDCIMDGAYTEIGLDSLFATYRRQA